MTPTPHDALFKAVFSEPENAAGELRSILPARIASAIIWRTLRLEPGSYIDDDLRERWSDLLFSAMLGTGRPVLVHLLFEHQSTADAWMAFRLLRYMLRIWEAFRAREPGAKRLPVIVPVVLHQGDGKDPWRAGRFLECIDLDADLSPDFAPFVPDFGFALDDLEHVDDAQLRARTLTAHVRFTLAVMRDARGATELDLIARFEDEVRELLAQPSGVDAFRLLMRYVLQVSNVAVDDLRIAVAALGPRAEEAIVTTGEMLVEKGRVEGRVEGRAEAVLMLLTARDVTLSTTERERLLTCRDLALLDRWLLAAATAASANDVFA